jgi:hypothetical protein
MTGSNHSVSPFDFCVSIRTKGDYLAGFSAAMPLTLCKLR